MLRTVQTHTYVLCHINKQTRVKLFWTRLCFVEPHDCNGVLLEKKVTRVCFMHQKRTLRATAEQYFIFLKVRQADN